MAEFFDLLRTALGTPTAKLFIVAGLVFLGVAIVGNSTGRIQPGAVGRILGGLVGPMLIVGGLSLEMASIRATTTQAQTVVATPTQAATRTPTVTRTPTATRTPTPSAKPKLGTPSAPPNPTLVAITEKREASSDALQDTIREYNSKAKGIIDSMGR